jgi:hypothetical protein
MNPYEVGVLDRKIHERMVKAIDRYAQQAGIPVAAICTHLAHYVGEDEQEWVSEYLASPRNDPPPGLLYVGAWPDVGTRMTGIAGAFIRNFVDARVVTVHQLVEADFPDCAVLLVPNFYAPGGNLTAWRAAKLVDGVLVRLHAGRPVVLHVADLDTMETAYGAPLRNALGVLKGVG